MRAFVTIVSGVPRSGTSLGMQMLEAGGMPLLCDGARAPDAHNPRGYYELAAVKRSAADASWLAEAPGRAVKVVASLLPHLPTEPVYRILLLRRSAWEIEASQRAMLGASEPTGPEEPARWDERWERELALALAWAAAAPRAALLELEHAELVAEPLRAAVAIDRFLGGGLDRAAMAAVVDPALHRQRRDP